MLSDRTRRELSRERSRRVIKAERDSGFCECQGTWRGDRCEVSVTFYPSTKWWVDINSKRYPLTDEMWAEIEVDQSYQ